MSAAFRKARRFLAGMLLGRWRDTRLAIVVHPGRTGSTLLGDLLDQHENIDWASEVFSKVHKSEQHHLIKSLSWRLRNPVLKDADDNVLWRETLELRRRRCALPTLGIEIKTNQIFRQKLFGADIATALDALNTVADVPLIFLRRNNHLERYVSGVSAKQRSQYNFARGQNPEKVEVPLRRELMDPAYFSHKLEINNWLDQVMAIEADVAARVSSFGGLCLTYEDDIVPSPRIAYEKIMRHLGQEPHDVQTRMIKIDTRPLQERITNAARLQKILRPDLYDRFCRA